MTYMPTLLGKRAFQLLLAGQCISNTGEACRLVSVTLFLVNTTGSGVSAAFGLICAALPGLILSPFAGAIGDLLPEKPLLAAADILRSFLVLLFLRCSSAENIYMLLVLFSVADTLCGPARRKFVVTITGKKDILTANSLLTGASGAAFLVGPMLGGVLVDAFGTKPAFLVNSITYLISGLCILSIRYSGVARTLRRSSLVGFGRICSGMVEGFRYFKAQVLIREIVLVSVLLSFGMISVNMAFYPFAFDRLAVTAKGWSLMLSIFYGTNLVAMAATPLISKIRKGKELVLILACMAATAVIWALYAMADSLAVVLLLQFMEGTILAVCGIMLGTLLQTLSDKNFIARVSGVGDLMGSAGKLLAMLAAFVILKYLDYTVVFLVNSAILFVFSAANLMKPEARNPGAHQKLFL